MIDVHPLRDQYAGVRTAVAFIVIATALYWFLGPIGILYALGFEVIVVLIYRLITVFAELLDPDVY